jgi:hypothetical protein
MTPASDGLPSMLAYLTRVLKTPTIGRVWEELAAQARDENWSHEDYLAAVLQRQLADRESKGTTMRIRTAHFPAVKTLEDFNLDHLPSLRRDVLAHLATTTFVAKAENVILLGPVPCQYSCVACDLRFCWSGQAARRYWLITPPRSCVRCTGPVDATASGSWLGGSRDSPGPGGGQGRGPRR